MSETDSKLKICGECDNNYAHINHGLCNECIADTFDRHPCNRRGCTKVFELKEYSEEDYKDKYYPESFCSAFCELTHIQTDMIILSLNNISHQFLVQALYHVGHHYPCGKNCKEDLDNLKHCNSKCRALLRNMSTHHFQWDLAKRLKDQWGRSKNDAMPDSFGGRSVSTLDIEDLS